jgi:RND family efflux transporter MFP subunit
LGKFEVKEAESAPLTNKIPVTGRIAQDVENVAYAFPSRHGKIVKCFAHLGSVVKKDEILCVMKLEDSGELTEVKSPSSGVVIAEFIKVGEHVDQTTAMYSIADVSKLWANFDVYEKDIGSVSLGQKILIYPVSYPNKKFEGEIVFISPRVDESTYTVKIKALVDNADLLLKLGMFVRGEIVVLDEESYVIIPSEALQSVEGKRVVFVKSAAESFEVREVKVQSTNKEQTAIRDGVKEGEMVVAQGSFILKSKLLASEMEHAHSH